MPRTCADCPSTISRNARRCRPCRDKGQRGAANVRWKGGRVVINGYVYLYRPDHPRRDKRNYVSEHTLVMEAQLGRVLLPTENVHHRNGVKGDNRPSNLELWVRTQPAGQRAVDLLAWARELVATYGPLEPIIIPAANAA